MDIPNLLSLISILTWLTAGPGAIYIAGRFFAFLAENWQKWHTLPAWLKKLLPLIFALVLAVVATLLLRRPDLLEQISPWWALLMQIAIGYLGSQQQYQAIKQAQAIRQYYGLVHDLPVATLEIKEG